MSDQDDRRRAIRHLLDERDPNDARASYYAQHYQRSQLITERPDTARAVGYVCFSRTGLDLFRPFVTLRLPADNYAASERLLTQALQPGVPFIMSVLRRDLPLVKAFCDVQTEDEMAVMVMVRGRFEPVINVLVNQDDKPGLQRAYIRRDGAIVSTAITNWQTRDYAEIGITTSPLNRRQGWGQSVLAALTQFHTERGRTPLYYVAHTNVASRKLAESVGYVDLGGREVLIEGTMRAI